MQVFQMQANQLKLSDWLLSHYQKTGFSFGLFLWCVTFDIKNELGNREQWKAAPRLVTMWRQLLLFHLSFLSLYQTQSSCAARTETDGEWFTRQSPEFWRVSLTLPRCRNFATTKCTGVFQEKEPQGNESWLLLWGRLVTGNAVWLAIKNASTE